MNRIRRSIVLLLLTATGVLLVNGCGQMGPLFLPESTDAPAAESADESDEEEKQN